MGRANQPRDRRGRWTTTGRGASLGSQRNDFARALQHGPGGDNSGKSTVYAYLRDQDSPRGKAGSPYYIGVAGSVARPYENHRRHTSGKAGVPTPQDERQIRLLRSGLTHQQAREWEKYYIAKFGRADARTGRGLLRNGTDGGDGTTGRQVSSAERQKKSQAMKASLRQLKQHDSSEYERRLAARAETRSRAAAKKYGLSEAQAKKYVQLSRKEKQSVAAAYKRGERDGAKLLAPQAKAGSAEWLAKRRTVQAQEATAKLERSSAKYKISSDTYAALTPKQRNTLRAYMKTHPEATGQDYAIRKGWA
jgi:hypothetical protein